MEAATFLFLTIPGVVWLLAPRDEVMFTGRRRIMLLSRKDEELLILAMGDELQELLGSKLLPSSHKLHKLVVRVASKVVAAAAANGVEYDWSVNVVDTQDRNAFCMPGGIIVVTTAMLQWLDRQVRSGVLCDVETGLASILCHEVAHAVAQHPAEGIAQAPVSLALALLSESSPLLPPLVEVSLNLPYSRMVEREADTIGFVLYSYTDYDLESYPLLYALLDNNGGSGDVEEQGASSEADNDGDASNDDDEYEEGAPIEWLSTHPSGINRAEATAALLPLMREARKSLREPLPGLQRTVGGLLGTVDRDGAKVKLVPWGHVPELHQALQEHAAAQWSATKWSFLPSWLVGGGGSGAASAPDDEVTPLSPVGAAERIAHTKGDSTSGVTDKASARRRGPLSIFDGSLRGDDHQEESER